MNREELAHTAALAVRSIKEMDVAAALDRGDYQRAIQIAKQWPNFRDAEAGPGDFHLLSCKGVGSRTYYAILDEFDSVGGFASANLDGVNLTRDTGYGWNKRVMEKTLKAIQAEFRQRSGWLSDGEWADFYFTEPALCV